MTCMSEIYLILSYLVAVRLLVTTIVIVTTVKIVKIVTSSGA